MNIWMPNIGEKLKNILEKLKKNEKNAAITEVDDSSKLEVLDEIWVPNLKKKFGKQIFKYMSIVISFFQIIVKKVINYVHACN